MDSDALPNLPKPPPPSSPAARAVMRGNRSWDTAPELALRRELHRRGLRYRVHAPVLPGLRCTPDVAFTRARVALFVDGCFWHRCPLHATNPVANSDFWTAKFERVVARDRAHDEALAAAGWTVVRVWEHEQPRKAADRVQAAITASLRGSRPPQPRAAAAAPHQADRTRGRTRISTPLFRP